MGGFSRVGGISSARLSRLSRLAAEKVAQNRDVLLAVRDDLGAMVRLVASYARGEYREVPWRSLLAISACLVYLVNPADSIPDWVPATGLVDDAAFIGLIVQAIRDDLKRFRSWEGGRLQGA
jgi:uncharacterized membrane protein YkvA (DUF1232 family)